MILNKYNICDESRQPAKKSYNAFNGLYFTQKKKYI
jgi:hypothetical protein